MDGIRLSFPPESPPLSVIVALSLSASQVTIDSSAAATTVPSVAFSNRWESFSKSKKKAQGSLWLQSKDSQQATKADAQDKGKPEVDLPEAEIGKILDMPSGYLHIGHAKAALLNKYFAERFDDTNPAEESNEFMDNLVKDIGTLGIKYEKMTYTSDYFPELIEFDYLITMKKLEDDDEVADFVNSNTQKETLALGDSNMWNLKCGDVIQLERKGYFRCDVPFVKSSNPIVLFSIPDGRALHLLECGQHSLYCMSRRGNENAAPEPKVVVTPSNKNNENDIPPPLNNDASSSKSPAITTVTESVGFHETINEGDTVESFKSVISPGVFVSEMPQPRFCEIMISMVEKLGEWVNVTKIQIMRPNFMIFSPQVSRSTCAGFVVDCGEDRDHEYGDSPTLYFKKGKKSQALAARRKEEIFDDSHIPDQVVLHHSARATTCGHWANVNLLSTGDENVAEGILKLV
ncbi:Ribosomal protein L25/Gln-tRNA synthetase anti-codon-binding domain superfamily [Arabidopsis thaliana x Arabidopsis arenosa]|uniref:Ribosomal protein L25/Gln-tRNA synthetase anti-codon-binding domain superfamily n=1 Tax=Arabidopsis thaliana x Arabidopsis arenosa TaxID=1240361 RepID=A0A8T2GNW2_9BRAS|nr:Ribosomal protein L25/Gln-tRNA synthetase anti-codon-binding domain superfamily [Arabidopsis thaliana x Arabidopsis arenosa]